jgi:DNA-binding NarL/FixJ family response regulator
MISITLISQYEEDRAKISALLAEQDDFRIMSIGKDGYDALKSAITQSPDIIIMDFNIKGTKSSDLAPIIKRNSPSTSLIVLCSHEEHSTVAKALNAGISGYLLRHEGYFNLVSSVRSVFYGGIYFSESIKKNALHYFSTPTEILSTKPLSAQLDFSRNSFTLTEIGIFCGIGCGHSDRKIARNLNISIGSLRNSINQVKKKTGLNNRTQITIYALFGRVINIGKIRDALMETRESELIFAKQCQQVKP